MKKRKTNVRFNIIGSVIDKKTKILKDFDYIEVTKQGKTYMIEPFAKQMKAFKKLQDNNTNEILYGGGARGGKTWIGVFWIVLNCILYKNSKYLVGRKQLSDLKVTTLLTLFEVTGLFGLEKDIDYTVNAQDKFIKFTNGSIIFYKDFQNKPTDPMFDRLGSLELTGCLIEESQEVVNQVRHVLKGRFSKLEEYDSDGNLLWKKIPKMFYSCNPGKNWIYTDFYKPYTSKTLDNDKTFIPALATDNPYVPKGYIDNLRKADKITVERLLNGNFDYDDDPYALFPFDDLQQIFFNRLKSNYGDDMRMSIDLSGKGKDKTIIIIWKGTEVVKIIQEDITDWTKLIPKLIELETKYGIKRSNVVVDSDGLGENFIDFYKGHYRFKGGHSMIKDENVYKDEERFETLYKNLRSQCYFKLSDVIKDGSLYINGEMFREDIITELGFVKEKRSDTSDSKLRQIEAKAIMKQLLGHSPDFADALMMGMVFVIDNDYNRDFDIVFG